MTLEVRSLQLQPTCTTSRSAHEFQICNAWHGRTGNPKHKTSLSKSSFVTYGRNQGRILSELELGSSPNHQILQKHESSVNCVQTSLASNLQRSESLSFYGSILGGCKHLPPLRTRRNHIHRLFVVDKSVHDEDLGDGSKSFHDGELEFCPKRPGRSKASVETVDESGYVVKVSKELMSVFQYVEKVKRAHLKELSETLRQVAYACLFFSCVKGVVAPVVEVFKTSPPRWGKLTLVLAAFDGFAITYLALKATQPLERMSSLATECESHTNMMGSIEKEEEHMLQLALDLVRLFRRLRNLALLTAVTQFAHILHAMFQLKKSYPNFAFILIKFVKSWLSTPWV